MGTIADQVLEDTYFGTAFGMECAGVVVAVGEGAVENVRALARQSPPPIKAVFAPTSPPTRGLCHSRGFWQRCAEHERGADLYRFPDRLLCAG